MKNTSVMEDQNEDESPKKNTLWQISNGTSSVIVSRKRPSEGNYEKEKDLCIKYFDQWSESDQVEFVEHLISRMCHYQHGHINSYLKPMLQRDFITALPGEARARAGAPLGDIPASHCPSESLCCSRCREGQQEQGLDHIAENILSYLDARSLCAAELVCKEWQRVISEGMLWKKLIERMYKIAAWAAGASQRENPCFPVLPKDQYLFKNRPTDGPPNSFYRSLYPKIIQDIEMYNDIGSCCHACSPVLFLRVTGVDELQSCPPSPDEMKLGSCLCFPLPACIACPSVCEFLVVSMWKECCLLQLSGVCPCPQVWSTSTCEFVRTLNGHKRGIACLQYRDRLVVSGSSDNTIRLWDIECGACLRVLEGHEELVRCIRFDNKRIVSGAYDGKIKVWDLQAALDPRAPASTLCLRTLVSWYRDEI
ncbi:hypothetical protein EK904_013586 [Melospiza melodia maxima]|nr:hypothetical protein EK904_013586 [Melospiza melodia maxima]